MKLNNITKQNKYVADTKRKDPIFRMKLESNLVICCTVDIIYDIRKEINQTNSTSYMFIIVLIYFSAGSSQAKKGILLSVGGSPDRYIRPNNTSLTRFTLPSGDALISHAKKECSKHHQVDRVRAANPQPAPKESRKRTPLSSSRAESIAQQATKESSYSRSNPP